MIIDQQPTGFSPEDLLKNFERLQTDLNLIQNEFTQALEVWHTILAQEKQEFEKTLNERAQAWEREESQWQNERKAYGTRVQELETYFHGQLKETEKKAVHTLNELDAAWQQERARWQQTITQQAAEFQQTQGDQMTVQQRLEESVDQIAQENARLRAQSELIQSLEGQVAAWEKEKASWQEALTERLGELQQAQERWTLERQEKDALIQKLERALAERSNAHPHTAPPQKNAQDTVQVYMNSLETQVTALQDFVQQVFDPRRRKTDQRPAPSIRPPSSSANS